MQRGARVLLSRRSFLTGATALPAFWAWALAGETPPSILYRREPPPITSAEQVLDVMGFEPLARKALPPAHFAYIATGVDDDLTVARNHEAFAHYEIRARRFVDVSRIDTMREVYGVRWRSPLYLSAVGAMRAFHPEGELAVARAARARTTQLMLSTGSSTAVEQIATAVGAPFWLQLYPTDDWAVTTAIVRRAQAAGCSAIVLTLDSHVHPRNNETLKRAALTDTRPCITCHKNNSHDIWLRSPMFEGLDVSRVTGLLPPDLRAQVKGRLILKGVVTGEDASLALEHGVDGLIVSNHGGRNEETLRATIDCLPEVVTAVRGRVPVFLDGGVRRGTDIFKALALGAAGVGIGRPEAWGVAAYGQPGVEAVLDILNRELREIMIQAGTTTLGEITSARVLRSPA
jgi:isopentenyl diphosphate isomerase/L-lactate dehydrogenase-like FMN-dependent dehydrogenase